MSFGVLVDVCISILALMILFTLAAAAINEMIADNILNMRGKSLFKAVEGLLKKYGEIARPEERDAGGNVVRERGFTPEELKGAVAEFYARPSINALMERRSWVKRLFDRAFNRMSVKGDDRPPSAIEPAIFARAVGEVLGARLAAGEMRKIQLAAGGFERDFEWTMDRVSGWYVRKVKTSLFVIGLVLVIGSNVDLLGYARKLARDENLHAKVDATVTMIEALDAKAAADAQAAEAAAADVPAPPAEPAVPAAVTEQPAEPTPPAEEATLEQQLSAAAADASALAKELRAEANELYAEPDKAGATVGWQCIADAEQGVKAGFICGDAKANYLPLPNLAQVIGWLVVAFGVTLGAQFWFDLFRSLVNLRTPGKTNGTVEQLSAKN